VFVAGSQLDMSWAPDNLEADLNFAKTGI
jgi:hypothetical protein